MTLYIYRIQGGKRKADSGDQLRARVPTDDLDLNTDCTTTGPDVIQDDNPAQNAKPVQMDNAEMQAVPQTLRRSARERKPPERYEP